MTSCKLWLCRLGLPVAVLTVVLFASTSRPASADPEGPTAKDRYITTAVANYIEKKHLSGYALDDKMSERCLKMFLKTLDPMKVYFLQSDVDRFNKQREVLDDQILKGDIQFAYEVFGTFLKRIDERVVWVEDFVEQEHNFTIDEEIVRDPDATTYPVDDAEAVERWRKRIKFDFLRLRVDKEEEMTEQKQKEKIGRRYTSFARRMHQMDGDELLEIYLSAMTQSFDPHTSYMSPNSYKNFLISMRLELDGIGAALQSVDGVTVVHRIIPGGAAGKDKRLKAEDRIVGVGQGVDGEIENVVDMKLSEVVKRIRGKAGTVVRLELTNADGLDPRTIEITRARIELIDSEAHGDVFQHGTKSSGEPYKIGVINLPSFYLDMEGYRRGDPNFKSTTRDVRKILEGFNSDGVDAVIIDLRGNGGGSLQEAIRATGLFIEQGPVVQVKDIDDSVAVLPDPDGSITWKGPLLVMTSKFSASASEIFAGAIQDYDRGLIVGDHATHGKGTVQNLVDLGEKLFREIPNYPNLGALKITEQQFYRPSGASTQNRGVEADVELPSLTTHLDVGESDLDYAVAFDQVAPARYRNYAQVDDTIRRQLSKLSKERQEASEDFQRVQRNIKLYLEQKDRKCITLNEEKFRAEMEKLDAEKAEQETMEDIVEGSELGIQREMYLDEVIEIAVDYLQMMLVAQAR